jgi:hypothetical protein
MYTEHTYQPPLGWTEPEGQQSIGPADWAALVAKGLSFEPYRGNTRLLGVRGDCLNPLVVAGRDMLVTRRVLADEVLVDGGLYCIRWNDAAEIQLYRDRQNIPATEQITITKVLRFFAGEWWCQCKDSLARLNGEVVEMVVGVMSSCTEAVHAFANQLGVNAATSTYSLAVVGPNTYNAGTLPAAPTYYGQLTVQPVPLGGVPSATLTFDCVQTVGGSTAQVFIEAAWGPTQDSDICEIDLVSSSTRYTIQKFFTGVPINTVFTVSIRLGCSASASFTIKNTLLNVEIIKR